MKTRLQFRASVRSSRHRPWPLTPPPQNRPNPYPKEASGSMMPSIEPGRVAGSEGELAVKVWADSPVAPRQISPIKKIKNLALSLIFFPPCHPELLAPLTNDRLLRRRGHLFDLGLETVERPRPSYEGEALDLRGVGRVGQTQDEARRSRRAGLLRFGHVLSNGRRVVAAVHALLELRDIEAQRFGMRLPGFERFLLLHQPVVHLPELPLIVSA